MEGEAALVSGEGRVIRRRRRGQRADLFRLVAHGEGDVAKIIPAYVFQAQVNAGKVVAVQGDGCRRCRRFGLGGGDAGGEQ